MIIRYRLFFFTAVLLVSLLDSSAQVFVRVTDPQNAAATDLGQTNYNGAAWVDYDNDGDEDLFACRNRMYRNDGDGVFVSVIIGVYHFPGLGNSCSWGDYDNDGDLDVYIGSAPHSGLFRNDGDDLFTAIAEGSIDWHLDNRAFAGAFGDYDHDGNLDIIAVHPDSSLGLPSLENAVYHNDGPPNYSFTRVFDTDISMGHAPFTVGSFSDYDLDGDQDFFIGAGPIQSPGLDFMYVNQLRESGFPFMIQVVEGPIATTPRDGQHLNWIDYDNDGDLDCYITNYQGGVLNGMANDLYRNDGDQNFTEITAGPIVTDAQISLGSCWADFDNDGDLDCVVANDFGQNKFYLNQGNGVFQRINNPVSAVWGKYRCPVAGDYDQDGDLDLFISGVDTSQSFFRNDLDNGNHSLSLKCAGTISNRAALGTRIRLLANIGGQQVWQQREINSQNSFCGHNSYVVHFGLGTQTTVDSIEIHWPSGIVQILTNIPADQRLTITEDSTLAGTRDHRPESPSEFSLTTYPNPFNSTLSITVDAPLHQELTLSLYDMLGRKVDTIHHGKLAHTTINYSAPPTLATGPYFLRAATSNQTQIHKILLLK